MTLQRALELMNWIGSSGNMFRPQIRPETPSEKAEIMAVWKRMPGNACYYSAICQIVFELQGGVA